jgi:hypothetical protein
LHHIRWRNQKRNGSQFVEDFIPDKLIELALQAHPNVKHNKKVKKLEFRLNSPTPKMVAQWTKAMIAGLPKFCTSTDLAA